MRDLKDDEENEMRQRNMEPFHEMFARPEFITLRQDVEKLLSFHGNTIEKTSSHTKGEIHFLMVVLAGSVAANNIASVLRENHIEDTHEMEEFFKDFIFFTYHQLRGIIELTFDKSEAEIAEMIAKQHAKKETKGKFHA